METAEQALAYKPHWPGKGSANFVRDKLHEPLYAIVPHFNPWRHKSRVKHAERALKHFHDSGAVIVLVEIAFNRRDHVFADSGLDGMLSECGISGGQHRHKYIGLRTKDELWLKENAINIGVQNLPYDWAQVCWLDSDVTFARPNWVGEAAHQLQHGGERQTMFLQMFSQARDLAPNYEMMPENYPHANGVSFVKAWQDGTLKTTLTPQIQKDLTDVGMDIKNLAVDFEKLKSDLTNPPPYPTPRVFPGLAWACTRQAWDAVGGLPDFCIWGGADYHMSRALIGKTDDMMNPNMHKNYKKLVTQWYQRCRTHIRRNVGTMEGAVFHSWHGRKTERGYGLKSSLLASVQYDPLRHVKRDSQGLWQLHDDGSETFIQLRDGFREISQGRHEDDSDTRLDLWSQGH